MQYGELRWRGEHSRHAHEMAHAELLLCSGADEQHLAVLLQEALPGQVTQDRLGAAVERCEAVPLRVDAIICGVHPSIESPSFVFVELKRWSTVFETVGNLVRQHRDGQLTQHPADLVRGYCEYLRRAVPALADDAPLSNLWATDPKGFGQVGCIYTAQGFECDWAGMIFGPDLV